MKSDETEEPMETVTQPIQKLTLPPLKPGQVVLLVPLSQFTAEIVHRQLFQPVVMK